jgi:hypothetical protein
MFELIGIFFSTWFVYRYLLFKPDRCVAARAPRAPGASRPCRPRFRAERRAALTRRPDAQRGAEAHARRAED